MKTWEHTARLAEYAMIAFMAIAVLFLLTIDPPSGAGPIAGLIGIRFAMFFYAGLYAFEVILWIISKTRKSIRMRKWVLFTIFLTHQFTFFLAWNISGFGVKLIDNLFIWFVSGWLWIRTKLEHDYVEYEDLETFDEER